VSDRFLRTPRWIAFSAAIALLMVAMVGACIWQLQRWEERKDRNAAILARQDQPTVDVRELSQADDEREWRTVTAVGEFAVDQQVFVGFRSFDGSPGYHVLTPLVMDDGDSVLVNRGWVPLPRDPDAVPTAPDPPVEGTVRVDGRVRLSQSRGALGPDESFDAARRTTPRANVDIIQQAVSTPLLDVYVEQIGAQSPDQPRLIPPPALDEGPHLSYAGQWAIFTIAAGVGWWVVVRRHAKREAARSALLGSPIGSAR
jgi:surfeit locus 1 family protein